MTIGGSGTTPLDERELLEGLRAGKDDAYDRLVRDHAGRMLAVAQRLLRNEDEARDAVQEAFLSAFKAMDRFAGDSRLGTWLHRITVNAALMRMRTRRRKPEESIDDLLPGFLEDGHHAQTPVEWPPLSDEEVSRGETRRLVRKSIDRLPESYRTVLLLRDIEDLDTAETAQALGISEGAVKTRLHRARLALRDLLDPALRGAVA